MKRLLVLTLAQSTVFAPAAPAAAKGHEGSRRRLQSRLSEPRF